MELKKVAERIRSAYRDAKEDGIERYADLLKTVLEELLTKHEAELSNWGRAEFWSDTAYVTSYGETFTFTCQSCKALVALAKEYGFKLEVIFNTYHGTKIKISVIE